MLSRAYRNLLLSSQLFSVPFLDLFFRQTGSRRHYQLTGRTVSPQLQFDLVGEKLATAGKSQNPLQTTGKNKNFCTVGQDLILQRESLGLSVE